MWKVQFICMLAFGSSFSGDGDCVCYDIDATDGVAALEICFGCSWLGGMKWSLYPTVTVVPLYKKCDTLMFFLVLQKFLCCV